MYSQKLFLVAVISGLLVMGSYTYHSKVAENPLSASLVTKSISRAEIYKNRGIVGCSPDWSVLNIDSMVSAITLLPGWGNYEWSIQSSSDSARRYFQQGISMYYSFHIIEAMASFQKAARFDDGNAMIYWAQALAYGPNINDYETNISPEAYQAAQTAVKLSRDCTPKEKALIAAMAVRYNNDTTTKTPVFNEAYTAGMKTAYLAFPKDADIAALYADAMMLEHPWKYWQHNGQPHPWTNHLLEVLESALQAAPNHPGANHYYIHCTEASPNPLRALKSADRLSGLLPSVSHMVHMPSHIYIRSGMYDKGMKVNEMSINGYETYKSLFPPVVKNSPIYLIHNLHMQTACAMLGAGYEYSAKAAAATRASFDSSFMSEPMPFGGFVQYVYMTPVFNQVRFGKWDSVIATPDIPVAHVYADILEHWAKGMAYARLKQLPQAEKELKYVQDHMNHEDMLVVLQPYNAPVDAARVAAKLLEGIIAEESGNYAKAITSLEEAIKYEATMVYNEPKDWILPIRPYLGAVMLKAGRPADAERVFTEDLKDNPNNHWALKGLYEALTKQGKQQQAGKTKKELVKSLEVAGMKDAPIVY
jgi:tetratricopeptide (TPR) repeat protein